MNFDLCDYKMQGGEFQIFKTAAMKTFLPVFHWSEARRADIFVEQFFKLFSRDSKSEPPWPPDLAIRCEQGG
ncbi:MAG: hypothetical protein DRI57_26575 [Deltaproteobacteria bacterium]|nr:MAG: hypothetical protein DRI57_26575 [Deltaproteobacteria bacterium]